MEAVFKQILVHFLQVMLKPIRSRTWSMNSQLIESYAFWKSSFKRAISFLLRLAQLMTSFAMSAPSRICLPATKAVWDSPTRSGRTHLILEAITFEMTLYMLQTMLIGLYFGRLEAPSTLGIKATQVVLMDLGRVPLQKKASTVLGRSSPTVSHVRLRKPKLYPSYPGAFDESQAQTALLTSSNEGISSKLMAWAFERRGPSNFPILRHADLSFEYRFLKYLMISFLIHRGLVTKARSPISDLVHFLLCLKEVMVWKCLVFLSLHLMALVRAICTQYCSLR